MDKRQRTISDKSVAIARLNVSRRTSDFKIERLAGEFSNGNERAVDRNGRNRGVDTRTVREPGIDHWTRFVHAPADGTDDLVDDPQNVRVILETHRNALELGLSARYIRSRWS